jgi:hypothetical protein
MLETIHLIYSAEPAESNTESRSPQLILFQLENDCRGNFGEDVIPPLKKRNNFYLHLPIHM